MLHVALIYGGQSTEHQVSLVSAQNILNALDHKRYQVTLIHIDQSGRWYQVASGQDLTSAKIDEMSSREPVTMSPDGLLTREDRSQNPVKVDIVFPVLHGVNGEDGTIQGLLQLYGIPCVGADMLSSAVCMDKDISKRLLKEAGIQVPKFKVLYNGGRNFPSYDYVAHELGETLFVKPANAGSSVGISRVSSLMDYQTALDMAFLYDEKVLIEQAIIGREIECAVLGRNPMRVSVCGEITTSHSFYSYEAKYQDESSTDLIIPASLPDKIEREIRQLAQDVCYVLGCRAMARVDFFLDQNHQVLVNEVNTIPGFTPVSMYPLLWEHSGVSFSELMDTLILDAISSHQKRLRLIRQH
ncbi:MAG: D-alanine--D-alanine ligase [Bacteroidetes bacterium]|nr:D-alanine--D-alanine ligase [Bacteroidota bacterium]MCY4232476.1 D-alanine--D-alanine ligase [Bacteroidota bacterium]